ncbi:hypothetical protein TCAP_05449 [Tolypocladium capitatum]|uniref:Uncharacterized protein n=1 Tax=Tolypocladium capitatum TaxID=45235 RepID=A0A2K3QAN0_9HYPO|nr:hypothetical protein TCAP_05449 [Tolypocladium capitatum]
MQRRRRRHCPPTRGRRRCLQAQLQRERQHARRLRQDRCDVLVGSAPIVRRGNR